MSNVIEGSNLRGDTIQVPKWVPIILRCMTITNLGKKLSVLYTKALPLGSDAINRRFNPLITKVF
jgi:hypothetical protein